MKRHRLTLVALALLAFVGIGTWMLRNRAAPMPRVDDGTRAAPQAVSVPAPAQAGETSAPAESDPPGGYGRDWVAAQRLRLAYAQDWSQPLPPEMAAFRAWTVRYAAAGDAEARAALETEGIALARARRPRMRALIEADPQRALAVTVPMAIREQLPASVLTELEVRVGGTGDLQTLCVTPVLGSGVAATIRQQVDLAGVSYEAHVYGRRELQQTEYGASLHGIALDAHLALHEAPVRLLEVGESIAASVEIAPRCPISGATIAPTADTILVAMHDRVWPLARPDLLSVLEARLVAAEDVSGPTAPLTFEPEALVAVPPIAEAAPTAWTTGAKTLLVIRVDFSDSVGAQMTQQAGLDLMNNQVAPYFDQASYGAASLVPTVTANVYRMPQTAAAYQSGNLTSQLYQDAAAAASADYAISTYQHVMIVFKRVTGSNWSWAGLGNIGGGRTWINGYFDFRVTAHELGHNFGLYHANQWRVTDGNPVSDGGTSAEYADPYDVMGGGSATTNHHFGTWFKNRLGWLPDHAVTRVATSGTYRITRFDHRSTPTHQPLALSIYRDGVRTYWIGFRQNFSSNTSLFSGAFVQWGFNNNRDSELLDMTTPGSSLNDAGLRIGSVFTDAAFGITLRPVVKGGGSPSEYLDVEVTFDPSAAARVIGWGSAQPSTPPTGLTGVVALAAGASHSVALKDDGTVVAWGQNAAGQASVPAGLSGVTSIAAGSNVSGAVKTDGTVVLWGDTTHNVTTAPVGLAGVRQLALGTNHALALKHDGTVVAWGSNGSGQSTVPAGLSNVAAIAAGQSLSVALRADGTVVSWGANYGPAPAGLSGVTALAASHTHLVARKADGTVVAWGTNTAGQCNVPAGLTGVVTVAAGSSHSLALKSDGTVVGWGSNTQGQRTAPAGIPSIQAIAAAGNHSLALTGVPGPVASAGPTITAQPASATVVAGAGATLSVSATVSGGATLTYQWRRDGVDIAGATGSTHTLLHAQGFDAGSYTVVVSDGDTSVVSSVATVTVNPAPPSNARLMNLSTRALCLTGSNALIPGFIISGTGTKRMLIRGVGPTLANFDLTGTLADPRITLMSGATAIASNDDWGMNLNAAEIVATAGDVFAFPLNSGSKDAVLLVDLPPGLYTVPTVGAADGTGLAIVELYDADTGTPTAGLVNISNRGFVGIGGSVMIPGFVISSEGSRTLLIRAVGPTLGAAPFNVPGVLADPRLRVFNSSAVEILHNDDWGANPQAAQTATTAAAVSAFPLPQGSKDAAFVVTLPPGLYTVQVSGQDNTTGTALVELYLVP